MVGETKFTLWSKLTETVQDIEVSDHVDLRSDVPRPKVASKNCDVRVAVPIGEVGIDNSDRRGSVDRNVLSGSWRDKTDYSRAAHPVYISAICTSQEDLVLKIAEVVAEECDVRPSSRRRPVARQVEHLWSDQMVQFLTSLGVFAADSNSRGQLSSSSAEETLWKDTSQDRVANILRLRTLDVVQQHTHVDHVLLCPETSSVHRQDPIGQQLLLDRGER
eukprot:766748-Hanusia_phi.AAC.4